MMICSMLLKRGWFFECGVVGEKVRWCIENGFSFVFECGVVGERVRGCSENEFKSRKMGVRKGCVGGYRCCSRALARNYPFTSDDNSVVYYA